MDRVEIYRDIFRAQVSETLAESNALRNKQDSELAAAKPEDVEAIKAKHEQQTKALDAEHRERIQTSFWLPAWGAFGTALVAGAFWVVSKIPIAWGSLPGLFQSGWAQAAMSLLIIVLGYLFFVLRKNHRFFYATLELGVAAATAARSASELATDQDRWGWVLALSGSLYIAVRAFDNFDKALDEFKEAERLKNNPTTELDE